MKRVAIVLALTVACGLNPGTGTHDVMLTNGTANRLVVYELQRGPGLARIIEPQSTLKSSWPYPTSSSDTRRARLEADDDSGRLVYCREFTWEQLERAGWKITLVLMDECPK